MSNFTARDLSASDIFVRVLTHWRPKQQERGTCYFVYAGRRYTLPKVLGFIQTAPELLKSQ